VTSTARVRFIGIAVVLVFVTLGVRGENSRKPVLVSFLPLLESARRIADSRLEVGTLLPVGTSPHRFDPTPKDLVRVRDAGLLLLNGYGIDAWLERLWRASGGSARLVKLAERASFSRIGAPRAVDAHVWLDASIMAAMALEIGEAYAAYDASNAAVYRRNASSERSRLLALHAELRTNLEPIRGSGLVVFHNAWNYFVRAYGLRVLATVRVQPEREPSAREMAELVTLMRRERVSALFVEPQLPDRAARAIAGDVGARVYVLDPEGSGLAPDYTTMMRLNASTLLEALR
jgi:ABC-type Zn uptake system ZnuABC Zn-binding protein ZnuA